MIAATGNQSHSKDLISMNRKPPKRCRHCLAHSSHQDRCGRFAQCKTRPLDNHQNLRARSGSHGYFRVFWRDRKNCGLGGGAEWIRSFGVARSLAEGKRDQRLVIFRVELCWHPRENEFAVRSVRYPTLSFNSGVARMRPGCDTTSDKSSRATGCRTNSTSSPY